MRRKRLTISHNVVVAISIGIGLFAGCTFLDGDDEAFQAVPFETLDVMDSLTVTWPGVRVFREEGEWHDFWQAHLHIVPRPPAPDVDFSDSMVVGLFWSVPQSGCTNVVDVVRRVVKTKEALRISIGPIPDLGNCLGIVHPGQIIILERSQLQVVPLGNIPQ